MFYVTNNKIHISRGDTPTYKVFIVDSDGAPYRISSGLNDVIITFTVRDSIWASGDDYEFMINSVMVAKPATDYPDVIQVHTFEEVGVGDYNQLYNDSGLTGTPQWLDTCVPALTADDTSKLYELINIDGSREYRYFDDNLAENKWVEYSLAFGFTFPYEETSILENKTYYYDMSLYAGQLKEDYSEDFPLSTVDYKFQLLSPTEFIVEGSISE